MIQTSDKNQNKKIELLSNGLDKLLSDKYILAKDIRDLNKTLQQSINTLRIQEDEVKDKLNFKEKLEQYINNITEIQTGPYLRELKKKMVNELVEKFNLKNDPLKLLETIKDENSDFIRIKQFMIEYALSLPQEITNLREKIENRNKVNSEVADERDHMKLQLKNIEEEIADYKRREIDKE